MQSFKAKYLIRIFLGCVSLTSLQLQAAPEYTGPGRYANVSQSHSYKNHHEYQNKHAKKYKRHLNHHSDERMIDRAEVIYVEPITKLVRVSNPETKCWQEKVTYQDRRSDSSTGAILGGIIGAAVGNELGHKKSNKRVGTVAGAVLGSSIGNDISKKNRRSYQGYEEKCETYENYYEEEQVDGYLVEYKYQGNVFSTRTQTHPGDYLKVRVKVTPII